MASQSQIHNYYFGILSYFTYFLISSQSQVDSIYCYLSTAFDFVSHSILLTNFVRMGYLTVI